MNLNNNVLRCIIGIFMALVVNIFGFDKNIEFKLFTGKQQYYKFEPIYFDVQIRNLSNSVSFKLIHIYIGYGGFDFCNVLNNNKCVNDFSRKYSQHTSIMPRSVPKGKTVRSIGSITTNSIDELLGNSRKMKIYAKTRIIYSDSIFDISSDTIALDISPLNEYDKNFLSSFSKITKYDAVDNSNYRILFPSIITRKNRIKLRIKFQNVLDTLSKYKNSVFYPYFMSYLITDPNAYIVNKSSNKKHLDKLIKFNIGDYSNADPYSKILHHKKCVGRFAGVNPKRDPLHKQKKNMFDESVKKLKNICKKSNLNSVYNKNKISGNAESIEINSLLNHIEMKK